MLNSHPKIIYKNLQQIIRKSELSTKRTSQQMQKPLSEYIAKSQPRKQKIKTQQQQRLSPSLSKHSLKSKQKININIKTQQRKYKNIRQINLQEIQNIISECRFNNVVNHNQSFFYNQIDAIFIQLEDYLRQTKQKLFINFQNHIQSTTHNQLCHNIQIYSHQFINQMNSLLKALNQNTPNDNHLLKSKNIWKQIQKQDRQTKQSQKQRKQQQIRQYQKQIEQNKSKSNLFDKFDIESQLLSSLSLKNKKLQQSIHKHNPTTNKIISNSKPTQPSLQYKNKQNQKFSTTFQSMKRLNKDKQKLDVSISQKKKIKSVYQTVLEDNFRSKFNSNGRIGANA